MQLYMSKKAQSYSNAVFFINIKCVLAICCFNVLFFSSIKAQLDTSHIYVDTVSRADLDPIQNTSLTLRPLSELTELAILNAPELLHNSGVNFRFERLIIPIVSGDI